MTSEDHALDVRRLAASLRAACDVEDAFGMTDAVLPPRTLAAPDLASLAGAPPTAGSTDAPTDTGTPPDLETLARTVAACRRCGLHESRTRTVFGTGRADADLMVVGEAPGADEDRQGVPFVGRAGQLLTKMLAAIDLPRDEVFICNILKCRPPGNRNPEASEIAGCLPYLKLQIDLVKPKIILALGAPSARTLLETRDGITRLRGRIFDRHGAKLVPSFHPAFLLRNPSAKRESWADLQLIRRLLDE